MLYITRDNAAVSCTAMIKETALEAICTYFGTSPNKVATIGDGIADIGFMTAPGIGFCGAPANASQRVKDAVLTNGGHVSKKRTFAGVSEVYKLSAEKGMQVYLSDKDGCLQEPGDFSGAVQISKWLNGAGIEGPQICIITGSSAAQNAKFIEECVNGARVNPYILEHPEIIWAENGAIRINVITGETSSNVDPGLEYFLNKELKPLTDRILADSMSPSGAMHAYTLSMHYNDQD